MIRPPKRKLEPVKQPARYPRSSTMQLNFLGKSYQASLPSYTGTAGEDEARFLGRRYQIRQFVVPQRQRSGEQL